MELEIEVKRGFEEVGRLVKVVNSGMVAKEMWKEKKERVYF